MIKISKSLEQFVVSDAQNPDIPNVVLYDKCGLNARNQQKEKKKFAQLCRQHMPQLSAKLGIFPAQTPAVGKGQPFADSIASCRQRLCRQPTQYYRQRLALCQQLFQAVGEEDGNRLNDVVSFADRTRSCR